MRQSGHACFIASLGQNVAQFRIAIVFIGHVADEMRQLVAGVVALEMHRIVQVVGRIHQPMRVKHHNGVNAQSTAASVNFMVAVNGRLARAFL